MPLELLALLAAQAVTPLPPPVDLDTIKAGAESHAPGPTPEQQRDFSDILANRRCQTRFLSDRSPWNTRIPPGARFIDVPEVRAFGVGMTGWQHDWGNVAIYFAKPTDPLVTIRWVENTWIPVAEGRWRRFGNPPQVEAEILAASKPVNPRPGNPYSTTHASIGYGGAGLPFDYNRWHQNSPLQVRIPSGAVPTPDIDGHAVIVQPDGRALELYSAIALSSGVWVSLMYSFTNALNGQGVGTENGRRASMIPSYAGVVMDSEMASGRIEHALNIVVPAKLLTTSYIYPATAFDFDSGYSGVLPMGSRLAIPPDVGLEKLHLKTPIGPVIAKAARDYGVIVTDRGGAGITIVTQYAPGSKLLTTSSAAHWDDLLEIFRHLRRVVNWRPDQKPGATASLDMRVPPCPPGPRAKPKADAHTPRQRQ